MKHIFLKEQWHIRPARDGIHLLYCGSCPYAFWHNHEMGMVKPFMISDVPKKVITIFIMYCWNTERNYETDAGARL